MHFQEFKARLRVCCLMFLGKVRDVQVGEDGLAKGAKGEIGRGTLRMQRNVPRRKANAAMRTRACPCVLVAAMCARACVPVRGMCVPVCGVSVCVCTGRMGVSTVGQCMPCMCAVSPPSEGPGGP